MIKRRKRRKKKKEIKTLNTVLVILAIFIVIFTGLCFWLFYKFQSVPDTLITCFYTSIVGELFVSGLIKIFKSKYEKENIDNDIRSNGDFN